MRKVTGLAAGLFLLALCAGEAGAGILNGDPNGMSGWSGVERLDGPYNWALIAVNVEFCVYAPGDFDATFPGQDPTGGTEYVYAYQIFNNLDPHPKIYPQFSADYVGRFSVGLDTDEGAGNAGYVPGTGAAPSNVDALGPGSTQAGWDFTGGQMSWKSVSAVLFFTSPNEPETDRATVSGAYASNEKQLPSPSNVPEPATLALLGLGGLVLADRRRRR